MSDSLTLTPPRQGGPPPTLEALALFRVREAAALHDKPAPPPTDPVVVLIAEEKGGTIAVAPSAQIIVLAEVRRGTKVRFFDR